MHLWGTAVKVSGLWDHRYGLQDQLLTRTPERPWRGISADDIQTWIEGECRKFSKNAKERYTFWVQTEEALGADFPGYVWKCVKNVRNKRVTKGELEAEARREYFKRRFRQAVAESDPTNPDEVLLDVTLRHDPTDPETGALGRIALARLWQKEPILRLKAEGYSQPEIAWMLGISQQRVSQRLKAVS